MNALTHVRRSLQDAMTPAVALSERIHAHPELGFEEHRASGWVADDLERLGYDVTRGVWDLPTAFCATAGSGPLHVAVIAEYDALPVIGHACGHNLIAASAVATAGAMAPLLDDLGLRLTVLGTPAEESGAGKQHAIDHGAFASVDAAMMIHPAQHDVLLPRVMAMANLRATFRGRTAHAAAYPHLGRNALDGLTIAQVAIGLARQQILPTDRIHGITLAGGDVVNVIPEQVVAQLMARSERRDRLVELREIVERCLQGGAWASRTELELQELSPRYDDMVHDPGLVEVLARNESLVGRSFGAGGDILISTDMGNVSHVVPSIHPMIGIGGNATNHQPEFTANCVGTAAESALHDGALLMAATMVEMSDKGR